MTHLTLQYHSHLPFFFLIDLGSLTVQGRGQYQRRIFLPFYALLNREGGGGAKHTFLNLKYNAKKYHIKILYKGGEEGTGGGGWGGLAKAQ